MGVNENITTDITRVAHAASYPGSSTAAIVPVGTR